MPATLAEGSQLGRQRGKRRMVRGAEKQEQLMVTGALTATEES